jgi:hypothetical protein
VGGPPRKLLYWVLELLDSVVGDEFLAVRGTS